MITLCSRCKIVYKETNWLVINDFNLHLCPNCMFYFKDKIVKELQNDRT